MGYLSKALKVLEDLESSEGESERKDQSTGQKNDPDEIWDSYKTRHGLLCIRRDRPETVLWLNGHGRKGKH